MTFLEAAKVYIREHGSQNQIERFEAGMMPDYHKVNVVYTDSKSGKDNVFGYVGSMANCDPTKGGWYYDADPDKGGTPTKVILCQASCALAQGDPLGKVAVVQGCATQTQPPPH